MGLLLPSSGAAWWRVEWLARKRGCFELNLELLEVMALLRLGVDFGFVLLFLVCFGLFL